MNGEQVSQKQLITLLTFFVFSTIIFTMPRALAAAANHSGWISILLAMSLFLLYSFLLVKVGRNMESRGLDIIGYCHYLLGPLIGKIFTFVFILIPLLLFSAMIVRISSEHLATFLLPETPIELMIAMNLIICYTMTSGGISTIAGWSQLIMPFVVIMISILLSLAFTNFKVEHIRPLFDASLPGILMGNQYILGAFAECAVLLFFWRSIGQRGRTMRSLLYVNLWAGFLILMTFFVTIGVYGVSSTKLTTFPVIEVIRDISLVQLIEHVESFSFVVWILIFFSKGSLSFFACCEGWRSWFVMKEYRPLMLPIMFVIYFLSLMPQNLTEAVIEFEFFKATVFPYYAFILLTFLILIDLIRKKAAS